MFRWSLFFVCLFSLWKMHIQVDQNILEFNSPNCFSPPLHSKKNPKKIKCFVSAFFSKGNFLTWNDFSFWILLPFLLKKSKDQSIYFWVEQNILFSLKLITSSFFAFFWKIFILGWRQTIHFFPIFQFSKLNQTISYSHSSVWYCYRCPDWARLPRI